MTNKTTIARILETGQSVFSVAISVSGHEMIGDEPVVSGGNDLGPSPYDFLCTALGECTAMTIRWYAEQQKWPLEKVEVRLSHYKDDKLDIFEKTVKLAGNRLTEDQRSKLIGIAAKCPIQRTLEGTPRISTFEHPVGWTVGLSSLD